MVDNDNLIDELDRIIDSLTESEERERSSSFDVYSNLPYLSLYKLRTTNSQLSLPLHKNPPSKETFIIIKELKRAVELLSNDFTGRIVNEDEPMLIRVVLILEIILHFGFKGIFKGNKTKSFILHSLQTHTIQEDFKEIIKMQKGFYLPNSVMMSKEFHELVSMLALLEKLEYNICIKEEIPVVFFDWKLIFEGNRLNLAALDPRAEMAAFVDKNELIELKLELKMQVSQNEYLNEQIALLQEKLKSAIQQITILSETNIELIKKLSEKEE